MKPHPFLILAFCVALFGPFVGPAMAVAHCRRGRQP